MDPIITDTLTVAGTASLVALLVQLTKWVIDVAVKDPTINARATRLWVFVVALGIVALPPLQHYGFHVRGDLLSLLTLASVVGAAAIGTYHALSQAPIVTPTAATPIAAAVVTEPPVA